MNILFFGLTSIGLYTLGTTYQALIYFRKLPSKPFFALLIGLVAAAAHSTMTYGLVSVNGGLDLSFFKASSLFASLIVAVLLIISVQRPTQNLFLVAYPIAIATILCALIFETNTEQLAYSNSGILSHIILSVLAYSVFTLSAGQAFLLYLQNKQLKTNYTSLLIRNLPPLQTMESLLFEMIWTGLILLTLGLISGAIFIENLFAQHLVHKTILSIIAWSIFTALLIGRNVKGWRGITASRWTLWGCLFLMLSYFGSKLVIEIIL